MPFTYKELLDAANESEKEMSGIKKAKKRFSLTASSLEKAQKRFKEISAKGDPDNIKVMMKFFENELTKNIEIHTKKKSYGINVDNGVINVELEIRLPIDLTTLSEISKIVETLGKKFKLKEKDMKMSEYNGMQNFLFTFTR